MNWFQKSAYNILGMDRFVNPIHFERYSQEFINPIADYDDFSTDQNKVNAVFSNPAVLKVFQICCNMFSQGEVFVYKSDKIVENDPFLKFISSPNMFQRKTQFLWDYMFWRMIGNAYLYSSSHIVTNTTLRSYWLDSSKLSMPIKMLEYKDKLVLSNATENIVKNFNVKYTYADGTSTNIKWGDIIHVPDLTNGNGNWFKGASKIDALYKIISNSENALDSKNINIRYAGKFMVAGKSDPDNVTKLGLETREKEDIESKMNGRKSVHAVKSMIDIKRFVEQSSVIGELDKSYLNDYFLIGSMYDIPKDVLEAFNSGTYENQEKARGAFVDYCLSPAAEHLSNEMEVFFGYNNEGKDIIVDWSHLPFMQVFEKDRTEINYKKTQSILNLMKAGVKMEEINAILDLNLTELDYESARQNNGQAGSSQSQNEGQEAEGSDTSQTEQNQ